MFSKILTLLQIVFSKEAILFLIYLLADKANNFCKHLKKFFLSWYYYLDPRYKDPKNCFTSVCTSSRFGKNSDSNELYSELK